MRVLRLAVAVVGLIVAGAAAGATVVEYYDASLDHYFMTPLANEIAALDSGEIAGWTRTGLVFDASATAGSGLQPVCRFYIPPVHGDSHFFSASPAECAAVVAKIGTDPNFRGYIEETPAEFYIALPDITSGSCPAGTSPVYRLWNARADSNHRYTADRATRDAMIARGYIAEGYGSDGVAMCTPRAGLGDSQVRVTTLSPYPPNCDGAPVTGIAYVGAEVEPQIAADPRDPSHLIGVWQQDRWSDGGARGLRTGYSFDGGLTWSVSQAPFTRCSGGNAANGGDYPRASDPWVALGGDGVAYQIAIAFNGDTLAPGSSSAVLVSRSHDGGRTWSNASTLIADGSNAFNDKESIVADRETAGAAYASWDRLETSGHGPSYFSRTQDGGATWEPARPIYDPGGRNQTLNNQVVVMPAPEGGALANFFTEFDVGQNGVVAHHHAFVRSTDRGATWSAPTFVADVLSVGVVDPQNRARPIRDASNLGSFAAAPDGRIVAVWQDSRFSAGARDGVVFSQSKDGGTTWSAPVQVNAVPSVQAFLPAVTVRDDGTIGVLYDDMRNDTADPLTLLVDVWLATSRDGVAWSERHVAGPFDFNVAPLAEGGLFVGDYQGLAAAGNAFAAFFATTQPDLANRTDIASSMLRDVPVTQKYLARGGAAAAMTREWRARIDASVAKTLRQRMIGPSTAAPPWPDSP
jgi:hypothetical protein